MHDLATKIIVFNISFYLLKFLCFEVATSRNRFSKLCSKSLFTFFFTCDFLKADNIYVDCVHEV